MKSLICVLFLATFAGAFKWPWQKPDTPRWSELSVNFNKVSDLPTNDNEAEDLGWTKTHSCGSESHFAGNRYVLKGDTSIMLLFDKIGNIAGIQNGIRKSEVAPLKPPWVSEGNLYVITFYFTFPSNICSEYLHRNINEYLGDTLILQIGPQWTRNMEIPFRQEGLKETNWVRGGCFLGMGRHYWYDISVDMSCDDFYPVFLQYKNDRLAGFGWVIEGHIRSPQYEHSSPNSLSRISIFPYGKMPKCILELESLTSLHVYLREISWAEIAW